ncbi:MAG TPA: alanine racemase [Candidatus Angelobacter sp.]|nr:alanine racemase [Candidatus Angelobacter sp.]
MPAPLTWVEVSTSALGHNLRTIEAHVGKQVTICAVIKSDAYGHGAAGCARALRHAGAKWFAVSSVEEGIALRKLGIEARVLVLSGFWHGEEQEIARHQLTPAIWDRGQIESLEKAAALTPRDRLAVHLKINTGMNRLGADIKDLPEIYKAIGSARHLALEGVFSHFAASEVVGQAHGDEQIRCFGEALALAEKMGLEVQIRHMANSAAIVARSQSWFNMVRPGLAIYGHCLPLSAASSESVPLALPLQPALTWKARVLQVRDVGPGQQVGYSAGHITTAETKIALLPVGYGDGLNRRLSARGRVIVRNAYAPILGNVSMNLTAVDVTHVPGVAVGDEAILIGKSASCRIDVTEHAQLAATIPYEILCNISSRLPRTYVETD